jgi:hypothetical protein
MQKARRHPLSRRTIGLRPLVGVWFQVHIPPLAGGLLTFRSRYCILSVVKEYLALRDGPRGFDPGFT